MLETYQIGETAVLKIEVRTAANVLYTPDTSITISIWGPDGEVAQAAANMTAEDTGIYYYDYATADLDAGCYRYEYTTVNGGRTSKGVDFFVLEDRSTGPVGWCVVSLADQIRSEMDVNPDAAGGRVPDRVMKLIREKGRWLFKYRDWLCRRAPGTLTLEDGETEADMPSDFRELDSRTMRHTGTGAYRLWWTQNVSAWQAAKDALGHSASAAPPRIALLYYTSGAWKARFWPEADQDYEYDYWYVKADPWTGSAPIADNIALSPTYWVADFDEVWHALCAYSIYGKYRTDDAWKGFKSEFNTKMTALIRENDETISDGLEPIEDAMGYWGRTASRMAQWVPPGNLSLWFAST